MNHKEIIDLLPAYLDKELGISDTAAIDQHLLQCPECQGALEEQAQVSQLLKQEATYFAAPSHLAHRIKVSLPQDHRKQTEAPKAWHVYWLRVGSMVAGMAALVWSVGLYLSVPSSQQRITDELISNHARSLQVDHLSDVISTDKHTVKPWFNGKLDYSPPVIDLAQEGYPLSGGRLDYFDHRAIAVLVYRHNQHPINLYIWPSKETDTPSQSFDRQGYQLIHWVSGGMEYWAVSDLAMNELQTFVDDWSAVR